MDRLQLEHFLAVVEEGTFTGRAQKVCRTERAVSRSINGLEDEIGLPLFAREVHEATLTEAGRRLVDYARRMLCLQEDAMPALSDLRTMRAGLAATTRRLGTARTAALFADRSTR